MGNIMCRGGRHRLVDNAKRDDDLVKNRSDSGVVMAQEDAVVRASTRSLEAIVPEECTTSIAVSPNNRAAAATLLSGVPLSPYFSERIQHLSEQRSDFANEVEFEIEFSKPHWTEMSKNESKESSLDDEDGPEESNTDAFERLKEHPEWGALFRRARYDLEIGEKIAEGGQAEIFAASGTDLRQGSKNIDLVVKVFKEGYSLRDLQRLWPPGLVNAALPFRYFSGNDGTFAGNTPKLCWAVDVQLVMGDRLAFVFVKHWGDLRKLIDMRMVMSCNSAPPFRFATTVKILLSIAEGMASLHKFGLLHRDLKAANVLVVGNGTRYHDRYASTAPLTYRPPTSVIVADFESSVGIAGTGFWRAPEVLREVVLAYQNRRRLNEETFTQQTDVYSYAMTCYEVITGRVPFDGHLLNDYDFVLGGGRPTLPDDTSPMLVDLVHRCWHEDPLRRPPFQAILRTLNDLLSSGSEYESWVYVSCDDQEDVPSDLRKFLDRRMHENKKEGRNESPFSLADMSRFMVQIAKGMRDLHRRGSLHTDLQSSYIRLNIVRSSINECSSICIREVDPSAEVVDTNLWRAPEMLLALRRGTSRREIFTKQSDVYSYAMTCYEVITGKVPFDYDTPSQSDYDKVLRGERPTLPHWLPAPVTKLINQCWHSDPSQRPSFEVISRKLDRLGYWCVPEGM